MNSGCIDPDVELLMPEMLTLWILVKINPVQALGATHRSHDAHEARAVEVLAEWLGKGLLESAEC